MLRRRTVHLNVMLYPETSLPVGKEGEGQEKVSKTTLTDVCLAFNFGVKILLRVER